MKKRFLLSVSVFWVACTAWPIFAQSYLGGSCDGYDRYGVSCRMGYPSVITLAATNVAPSSVCLNGMLLSTGTADAVVYAYWGTTDGGTNKGSWSNAVNFGVCPEYQTLTTNVAPNPNMAYFCRFYATNAAGYEAWAASSASFTTPGPPVLSAGLGAVPVGFSSAGLNGNLVLGGTADVTIYWGANTNSWANTNPVGNLSQGGTVNLAVSGLTPASVYYYRCYGTNSYGEGWSGVTTFTTTISLAAFYGGAYDGYDRWGKRSFLSCIAGTVFSVY
jgi:hypothetical protein